MTAIEDRITVAWFEKHLEAFASSFPNWSLDTVAARHVLALHLYGTLAQVIGAGDSIRREEHMRSESSRCGVVSPDGKHGCDLMRGHIDKGRQSCRNAYANLEWCGYCGTWTCVRHGIGLLQKARKGDTP